MYLDWKNNNEEYWILDIEADSLNPTKIWCIVIKNVRTKEVRKFTDVEEFRQFVISNPGIIWVGHNAISFDIPNINRLVSLDISLDRVVDTLVLSYLYFPAIAGGHSLETYGERFKFPKIKFYDFSKFSQEMLDYCTQDVELTYKVFLALTEKMNRLGFTELSAEIEHKTRYIIDEQQRNGFWFDRVGATNLLYELRQRESDLAKDIHKLFPPELKEVGRYIRRKRKDGSDYSSYERHLQEYNLVRDNEDGTYSVLEYVEFNIGSPKQRLERLLSVGFEPKEFTKKGSPKVDEDALVAFAQECGRPEIQAMSEWLVLNARCNMLENWLSYSDKDSRIHGKVFSCGASTRRMTHNSPNSANIPSAAKSKYGHECRALWGVEPKQGLKLVGVDASGLENVGLLHYLNNPKATEVLNKKKPDDIHSSNARKLTEALGREIDREWGAKTTWYAWLYGAYPPKLGQIVKGPPSDGEIVIDTFFSTVPGLKRLINSVQSEWQKNNGLLRTIDGGFVRCPSLNAALNYKIQSLGAIVMKLAAILLRQKSKESNLWFRLVGTIHDEWQLECKAEDADRLGKLAVSCIEEAAKILKFKVFLTGEYKIGDTWAETH